MRLLDAHPERPVDRERIVGCDAAEGDDHLEFLVPRMIRTACPNCQGTGRYVGLQTVEVCRTCGGAG
jgi:DnaJ-class molecular chaperone